MWKYAQHNVKHDVLAQTKYKNAPFNIIVVIATLIY